MPAHRDEQERHTREANERSPGKEGPGEGNKGVVGGERRGTDDAGGGQPQEQSEAMVPAGEPPVDEHLGNRPHPADRHEESHMGGKVCEPPPTHEERQRMGEQQAQGDTNQNCRTGRDQGESDVP